MAADRKNNKGKLQQLQTVRLVLILLAAVLTVSIALVGFLWLPKAETTPDPDSGVVTQPAQTIPGELPLKPEDDGEEKEAETPEEGLEDLDTKPPQTSPNRGNNEPSYEDYYGTNEEDDDWAPPVTEAPAPPVTETPAPPVTEAPAPPVTEAPAPPAPEVIVPDAPPLTDIPDVGGPVSALVRIADPENGSEDVNPAAVTENNATLGSQPVKAEKDNTPYIVFYLLIGLLVADLVAIAAVSSQIKKAKKMMMHQSPTPVIVTAAQERLSASSGVRVGQLHNIGARPYQEDSFGVAPLSDGILAVVADGMGGLSAGDKVSQKIVYTMLGFADQLRPGVHDGALEKMVAVTNDQVNAMLGPKGLYKSGSTLLAVLVRQNRFHWITVGDSHIYYYHNGHLQQLNEEHNRGTELLRKAARGEITYEEARSDPKRNGLTSFIGMGNLKYVDKSRDSIPLVPGDRILLMTDGVFNALPDRTIEAIMAQCPDVKVAAREMERLVLQKKHPKQDNFTAVILGF